MKKNWKIKKLNWKHQKLKKNYLKDPKERKRALALPSSKKAMYITQKNYFKAPKVVHQYLESSLEKFPDQRHA